MLESMIGNSRIREINPDTQRLVERCLSGDWCVSLMELRNEAGYGIKRAGSPNSDISNIISPPGVVGVTMPALQHLKMPGSNNVMKSMKFSKSVEHFGRSDQPSTSKQVPWSAVEQERRGSNASAHSLPGFGSPGPGPSFKAPTINSPPSAKKRSTSVAADSGHPSRHNSLPIPNYEASYHYNHGPAAFNTLRPHINPLARPDPGIDMDGITAAADSMSLQEHQPRRRPPPPPNMHISNANTSNANGSKRRKPPAIPIGRTNGGATITSIRSSEPSPLSKVHKPQIGV